MLSRIWTEMSLSVFFLLRLGRVSGKNRQYNIYSRLSAGQVACRNLEMLAVFSVHLINIEVRKNEQKQKL